MRTLTALFVIFALLAVAISAQQDPNVQYDAEGGATAYIFSFRVKLSEANVAITTIPTSCAFSKGYIARGQAFVEYIYPIPTGSTASPRPSYLAASRLLPEECRNGINEDETTWVQNYVPNCKFRSTCGGSTVCACAPDEACQLQYQTVDGTTTLVDSAYCVPSYLCSPDSEGSTTGKCVFGRQSFKITLFTKDVTEPIFYEIARSGTCSPYSFDITYILQSKKDLYFSATYTGEIPEACLNLFAQRFGAAVVVNSDQSCQSSCGGKACICEKGNSCSLTWDEKSQGNKQCDKNLRCQMSNGQPLCSNAVVLSALFAVVCAFIAIIM